MHKGILLCLAGALALAPLWPAGAQSAGAAKLKSGKEIFEAGCAGCHGADGRGAPETSTVFERPRTFPDFTACNATTPETDLAWRSVIREGGPSRGFVQIMPSFKDALSTAQIDAVITYLRGFCREPAWPRGELNLPRALGTEKAFPESEVLITTSMNAGGAPGVSTRIAYEQRFGARNQFEVSMPVSFVRPDPGLWYGGFGDMALGVKRVLAASLRTGSIFAVQGEAILPTGNRARDMGKGTPVFEGFAAYGQLLPAKTFLQFQGGIELPTDTEKAPRAFYARTVLGRSFNQSEGLGRMWSPMVEFLADRDLESGAVTNWDIMPEFQVTLNRRQHVRLNVGLRIPASNTAGRDKQVIFYLLWDWLDGKFYEGWK